MINISQSGCKCISLNARSIVNEMDELKRSVEEVEPDVIGITETWTTLPGYRMFRKDSKLRRGGGVIMYISESIQACEIQLKSEVNFNEDVWCRIETQGGKITVGGI